MSAIYYTMLVLVDREPIAICETPATSIPDAISKARAALAPQSRDPRVTFDVISSHTVTA